MVALASMFSAMDRFMLLVGSESRVWCLLWGLDERCSFSVEFPGMVSVGFGFKVRGSGGRRRSLGGVGAGCWEWAVDSCV